MTNLSSIVSQLQTQRKQVQSELSRLDAALNALRGLNSSSGPGVRTMSAASRKAISIAQKARWAKRAGRAGVAKPRRPMSAAARRKIAAAQKARWAAWRAKQKNAA